MATFNSTQYSALHLYDPSVLASLSTPSCTCSSRIIYCLAGYSPDSVIQVAADVRLGLYLKEPHQVSLHIVSDRGFVVRPKTYSAGIVVLPFKVMLEKVYLGFIPESASSLLATLVVLLFVITAMRLPQRTFRLLENSESAKGKIHAT